MNIRGIGLGIAGLLALATGCASSTAQQSSANIANPSAATLKMQNEIATQVCNGGALNYYARDMFASESSGEACEKAVKGTVAGCIQQMRKLFESGALVIDPKALEKSIEKARLTW